MTQTLTVEIPSGLYSRLQKRAEQAQHSVESEMLELLAAQVHATNELPAEFEKALAALELLDNVALERAAKSHLSAELAAELEALNLKQQREGLVEAESERSAELIRAYERAMLIRAEAAASLKRRGMDVSKLLATS
ncbi:MAG: hypothetical protein K8T89_10700 [Planctomycetes bacterium]|nr:hypothetical protein [Planctomycetota bacterium]